eukprot:gene13853-16850_t
MSYSDILVIAMGLTAVMILGVSILMLKVIKFYVKESVHPTPFPSPEEKARQEILKPSIWSKIMGLKPISEEKDLVMEHEFDGIAELNNPTPAWFMVLFYGTIFFALVYMFNYEVLGWGQNQEQEYDTEIEQAALAKEAFLLKPGNAKNAVNENNIEQSKDEAVIKNGAALFQNRCTPCHGEHGQGIVGPNLTDAYWSTGELEVILLVQKHLREKNNHKMSQQPDQFRDQISTLTDDGKKRKWIYPRIVKGTLYRYRSALSYFFLVLLFSAPFIRLNGEQLILLGVVERKFVFFGLIFWPQDFYLFVLGLLIFMVFIVLFTVVFGRVFCGWACPQTIFMEMIFRKIENWIEGDHIKQKKLNEGPLTTEKVLKKGLKHSVFLLISFFIANIFLAYLIGTPVLIRIITEPISSHLSGFISIWVFTFVFYLVFSRMRELVCTVACPYSRLQGVLLDNQSIIVAYDYERGEPRGKRNKETPDVKGDCIDCKLCVQVCPTGIDIRNGTQLECINCTACIDACDMVMQKIDRPLRLIGFKSEEEIKLKRPFKLSKRMYGYAAVLLALIALLSYLLISRSAVKTTMLRASGTLYQIREKDKTVSNLYNAELVNKTSKAIHFEIRSENPDAKIQYIQKEQELKYGGNVKLTFFVILPQKSIKQYKTEIGFKLISEGKVIDRFTSTFIAPPNE